MQVRMHGATDVGRKRKTNQDSLYFDAAAGIGIVADGIGGRQGGEVASSLAVQGIRKAFLDCERIRHEEISPFLTHAYDQLNAEILQRGREDPQCTGMGTTLNTVLFVGDKLYIAHIGDSRTYLFYKKHLFQLTLDHSVANFVERGWISRSSIQGVKEGALVKAMGLGDVCEADVYEVPLKPGMTFVTCSDGLTGMVSDQKMAQVLYDFQMQSQNKQLAKEHDKQTLLEKLPKTLIDLANQAGGRDNITVLVSVVQNT